ncbi:MAG: molybdopterin-dependent oxidoreductase, partial [Xanthomonadales bacterium]|nr:molybdopterin-dependent oxidoreductase [Xanthomonadales bacterium]
PVGALTDKVFQFKARAWEMLARPSLGYHDAGGANVWLHTLRGRVLRAVPRDNEAINECWLSDRDRYSHEGMYADDRVNTPLIKRDGQWHDADWDAGLGAAATILRDAGGDLGVLVQPAASCEEGVLLARLAAAQGSSHIDHRLRQLDFAGAAASAFSKPLHEVAAAKAALLVGSQLRHELPLFNSHVRKSVQAGAKVFALNPQRFDFNFKLAHEWVVSAPTMLDQLLVLAAAAQSQEQQPEANLAAALKDVDVSDAARDAIQTLRAQEDSIVLLGHLAAMHPQASWLRAAARFIAAATGSDYHEIPLGANSVGLSRAGVLPGKDGLDARAMLEQPRKAYVLFGAEPPEDFADGALLMQTLREAKVIAFAAFASEALKQVADVILPIALLPETDATLINLDGQIQSVGAAVSAPGSARPGWKVLRALGGQLQAPGFDFIDIAGLREQIASTIQTPLTSKPAQPLTERKSIPANTLVRLASVPIYRGDALLRRAGALNAHTLSRPPSVAIHPDDAKRLQLAANQQVLVDGSVALPVLIDDSVCVGSAWIEYAHAQTAMLPPYGAVISLDKA